MEFLSVVLGVGTIEEERLADLMDPQVISLAKSLSPAMLRLGGTRGDFLLFNEKSTIAGSEYILRIVLIWYILYR